MELYYLLLLPVTTVIAWALVFVKNGRYRKLHDRLFIGCAACGALSYLSLIHSLVEGTASYHFLLLDNLETLVGLSICPLLFLYIRSVSRDSKWHGWYWWLFAPALLISIVGTALSVIVGWDRIIEIRIDGYHPFIPEQDNVVERLYYIVNIQLFDIVIEIMAVVMIALCIFSIIRYRRNADHYYANIEDASIDKIRRFLASSILNLILLFSLTFFIQDILGMSYISLLAISLVFSSLLWIMSQSAFGIVVCEDSLDIIDTLTEHENLNAAEDNHISQKIESWLASAEKQYCQEGITLANVANNLNLNPRVLSAHINKNKQMNFRHWINTLRIAESKRLIEANSDEKLTYIAALCGFADLATFSKSFRLIEGCSPMDYKNKILLNKKTPSK